MDIIEAELLLDYASLIWQPANLKIWQLGNGEFVVCRLHPLWIFWESRDVGKAQQIQEDRWTGHASAEIEREAVAV